jgi:hypothetical protein
VCSALSFGFMSAVLTILSPRPVWRAMLAWAAANAFAAGLAFTAYGAWAASPPPDGGRRQFIVLTEEEGRPGQATYDLPVVGEPGPPLTGAGRLASLRARYELYAKLMDPAGLRSALVLGVKGNDDLARTILLQHLSSVPPSAEALSALGELADESAYRIGPMGATRIALAYAHLGDAARAEFWARRGAEGPRGIPAGLVDLSGGGALKPGRISGRLEGLRPLIIGLYRKTDPAEPYFLDAAGLVASAEPDAKGRFSFSGLTAGRYYLAFAFAAGSSPRVSGHRGDIALDARRAALDLPALTIK